MSVRPIVVVRPAVLDDAEELVRLWTECVAASSESGIEAFSYQALWREPSPQEARHALELNAQLRDRRILVAECDGRIVGAVVADVTTLTPISATQVLLVTDLQVAPDFRKRSVASTLLGAIASYGEKRDCDITVAMVSAHAREPNRFLTKLGFNQVSVMRAISTSRLRARLKKDSGDATGKLLAVRRTLRRRQGSAHFAG